jgi:hypothetical protein
MTRGYDFHPEAEIDLDAVWEYIAEDNPEAADRMIDAIEPSGRLFRFHIKAIVAPISLRARCASPTRGITS